MSATLTCPACGHSAKHTCVPHRMFYRLLTDDAWCDSDTDRESAEVFACDCGGAIAIRNGNRDGVLWSPLEKWEPNTWRWFLRTSGRQS